MIAIYGYFVALFITISLFVCRRLRANTLCLPSVDFSDGSSVDRAYINWWVSINGRIRMENPILKSYENPQNGWFIREHLINSCFILENPILKWMFRGYSNLRTPSEMMLQHHFCCHKFGACKSTILDNPTCIVYW